MLRTLTTKLGTLLTAVSSTFVSKRLFVWMSCLLISVTLSAQLNIDSLKKILAGTTLQDSHRIKTLNILAEQLNPDHTNEALVYANEAYLLALKSGNKSQQITALLNLSEGYLYNDSYEQALEYAYLALDLARSVNSRIEIANCHTNLGWIFYDTENPTYSQQSHRQALELYREIGELGKVALSLNAIGLVFQMKNQYDSANVYFEEALSLALKGNAPATTGAAYNNIGICENAQGRYRDAINWFTKSLQIHASLKNPLSEAETLNQMAYSYLMLKDYPETERLLQQSRALIQIASSNTKKEKLLDNLSISSSLYEALGDYKKAFANLQEYTQVRNQIITRNKSDAVAALKSKKETLEKETEIRELASLQRLRSFQRNILAAGIVLILIIGFLLYRQMKQKRKKEREIEEVRQALIKKELDNTLLEKEALHNKLNYKDAELKNYALYISQRNELVRGFIDNLTELKLEGELKKESLGKFNKMISKFQHDLDINKEAQDFNLSVDEIHKDFFFNLLQKYPDLTENERRLCAQIRLNLSIKDIASINNISVKSAEMARYRLRKHFNMAPGDNLNEFLRSF